MEQKRDIDKIIIHQSGHSIDTPSLMKKRYKSSGREQELPYDYLITNGSRLNGYGEVRKTDKVCEETEDALNICFLGEFNTHEPHPKQWEQGVKFVAILIKRHQLDITKVLWDEEVAHSLFDMEQFRNDVLYVLNNSTRPVGPKNPLKYRPAEVDESHFS